jgi:hypothetical protein
VNLIRAQNLTRIRDELLESGPSNQREANPDQRRYCCRHQRLCRLDCYNAAADVTGTHLLFDARDLLVREWRAVLILLNAQAIKRPFQRMA